ncbi:MAG TPA: cupin domain-containing protein [Deltaproteobacteria bacterium]|jgi:mannose-6-phosphate isomerase-like protein (cupin superfamily)|nr:cupin domain-containing protein [Deltaproteobacteria bacterium]HQI02106.1 cupin domain-containing protein [Deltaproteobacteria bacterium]HQJ08422.1 cupin domain-containing protein [Deltaproteobacteria bacterium]
MKTAYGKISPYITKDGSEIRELIHPDAGGSKRMSLAEATVLPGAATFFHVHRTSEEIYHIIRGSGFMTLGDEVFEVGEGDSILIRPGVPHRIENTGEGSLKILCCCSPPYSHEDTGLLS